MELPLPIPNGPTSNSVILHDKSHLETSWQRVVLNRQFDVVARPQKLHDSFLMCRAGHIGAVHLQDPIAHPQLAALRCNPLGNDLKMFASELTLNFNKKKFSHVK